MRVLIIAALGLACGLTTEPAPQHYGSGPRRMLFIGNSLTAWNDMPAMVVALAESARVSPLPSVDVQWQPDFALIDHWNQGKVQRVIADGHYDVVVLQQGPSSLAVNRDSLRLVAALFSAKIRATGAIPALFSVWPTIDRLADFDRATESYRLAASDVNGMLFPGGEVWRAAWQRDGSLAFYSGDGLHPSALGSYAVALSIVGMLYERSTVGLPYRFRTASGAQVRLDSAAAAIVQRAADEANRRFGLR